jgi:hypothetical protein
MVDQIFTIKEKISTNGHTVSIDWKLMSKGPRLKRQEVHILVTRSVQERKFDFIYLI